MTYPGDAEFGFELVTCRWVELAWPPGSPGDGPSSPARNAIDSGGDPAVVVGRQLGTRQRRWDTVVVETTPEKLAARARFGDQELDSDLLHIVRHAPEEWAWYRDALPHPGYPWRYVRAAIHRGAARGVVEKRRDGNRIQIRRIAPYPDWVDRLVAIENKPDLDASAARALADQLAHDVETALADEVWVATAATGQAVEPALLEDMPVEVGILAMDYSAPETGTRLWPSYAPGDADVVWYPSRLDGRTSAAQTDDGEGAALDDDSEEQEEQEEREERAERRLVLAERAYGRGWRSYVDTMRPDCRHFELRRAGAGGSDADVADTPTGAALVPWCAAKERHQTAAECAGSCASFEPEPPQWRTRGWPIEGGPGKGLKRVLERRRNRYR